MTRCARMVSGTLRLPILRNDTGTTLVPILKLLGNGMYLGFKPAPFRPHVPEAISNGQKQYK